MGNYSNTLMDHFTAPRNSGALDAGSHRRRHGSQECDLVTDKHRNLLEKSAAQNVQHRETAANDFFREPIDRVDVGSHPHPLFYLCASVCICG
jgi:hypothetical protein